MRIVVDGPERHVGALQGDNVVDLSGAYAKLAQERRPRKSALLRNRIVGKS